MNTMKTTFYLNFDLFQTFKQHDNPNKHENKETLLNNSLSFLLVYL